MQDGIIANTRAGTAIVLTFAQNGAETFTGSFRDTADNGLKVIYDGGAGSSWTLNGIHASLRNPPRRRSACCPWQSSRSAAAGAELVFFLYPLADAYGWQLTIEKENSGSYNCVPAIPTSMRFFLPFLFLCLASACSAKELKIFLLTGQSNSLGAVKGSPASPELLKKYEPGKTLYWHENFGQREGAFPGASTSWEQVRPAMPRYNGSLCMGPEYGFAFTLEKNGWFREADVAIIKASRDGGGNSHWQKNGQAYKALVQAVKNACAAVDRSTYTKVEFAGLLYLQGESNAGASVPESASRFVELLGNLAADLKPYGDTSALAAQKAVIGENANWSSRNESDPETGNVTGGLEGRDTEVQGKTTHRLLKELAMSRPSLGYAPTRDLPKLTAGDKMGVHYSGRSQISIGARFAYEAARLAGKDGGAVRSGRYEVALGSPDAWMNRKTPGNQVCVWNVASSVKPGVVSGVVKLFGVRVEDPAVDTVIIQSGGASSDRLVLGPGGIHLEGGKNLQLRTNIQLAGRQSWSIPGGSAVTMEPLLPAGAPDGKAVPVRLSGQAEVQVVRGKDGAAAEPARVVLKQVQAPALKCSWILAGKVEMFLEGMKGQSLNLGRILVKDGAALNLNGARLPAGSVVNQGGTVNP